VEAARVNPARIGVAEAIASKEQAIASKIGALGFKEQALAEKLRAALLTT
jgi:hypothetical protein